MTAQLLALFVSIVLMSDTTPETAAPAPPPISPDAPARPRAGNGPVLLIALLALILAGYVAWRQYAQSGHDNAVSADAQHLGTQVETLAHSLEQVRGSADTLRARIDDGAKVDKSVREELFSLSERTRLLEDAVANLADKRLSGHDALVLNETELLLSLGGERYTLFHDAAAAIAAYRLADTALSQVEDAAFSTVRQSIDAEIAELNSLQAADPAPLSIKLAQLRAQVPLLPALTRMPAPAPAAEESRLWRVLGAFVQVHHGEDAQASLGLRDAGLARELAILDLRDAEAALLARDDARYHAALTSAHAQLLAFDPSAAQVTAAQAELDALARSALAPPPPQILGAALRELRNLRATHALRAPARQGEAQK
jgi:uroporphyrin-3 C-methyltransferase